MAQENLMCPSRPACLKKKKDAVLHVNDLNLFVTVQLHEDTPPGMSLGKLFEDHGCLPECTAGKHQSLVRNG